MKVADVRNFNQIKLILENKNEIKIEICDLEELDLFISLISKDLDKFPILMVLKAAIIEFVLNGFKAYQKRKFFEINNFSLFDDYEKGNELFKQELTSGSINTTKFKDSDPFLYIHFQKLDNALITKVVNNFGMSKEEYSIVLNLMEKGKLITGVNSSFEHNKYAEGAGLGILLIFSMLKNSGVSLENLGFESKNNETCFYLKIPYTLFAKE